MFTIGGDGLSSPPVFVFGGDHFGNDRVHGDTVIFCEPLPVRVKINESAPQDFRS